MLLYDEGKANYSRNSTCIDLYIASYVEDLTIVTPDPEKIKDELKATGTN